MSQGTGGSDEAVLPAYGGAIHVRSGSESRESGLVIVRGLARILAFFALVAGVTFALDGAISTVLRRVSTGDFGIWNDIVQGRINADIVINGSSRALTHYDPRILEASSGRSSFNIGLNGSQTDMQVARFKTYLRHNRAPTLLIQNLDAFSFQVTHGEVYDPGQYLPYLSSEPDLYQALLRINPDTWRWRYVPLYGYAKEDMRFGWLTGIVHWLTGAQRQADLKGFKPRHSEWTEDFDRFRANNPDGVHVDVEPEGVQQVEELLRICAERGIKVALVYSPEFIEIQQMTSNRDEIFARFESVSRRYGGLLLDFSESPISARREFFYNSQHLNADGAQAFTTELAARLGAMGEATGQGSVQE